MAKSDDTSENPDNTDNNSEFDNIVSGVTNGETQVEGFQEGVHYPEIPQTPSQFRKLQDNPDLAPERQSAPSPEQLNPHLFGDSGRL